MRFQEYIAAVEQDAREWVADNRGYISADDDLIDVLWCEDSVTGNGSGSYTFSTYEAEQLTCDLVYDDEFINELQGLGEDIGSLLMRGAEAVDVTARCLALYYIDQEAIKDELLPAYEGCGLYEVSTNDITNYPIVIETEEQMNDVMQRAYTVDPYATIDLVYDL